MMANDIYGELIGCDEMHYSKVSEDSLESYTAATPKYLAPTADISHDTTVNASKRYYDNQPRYVDLNEGNTSVKIVISGVPCVLAAELTGKPYDTEKGLFYDTGDLSEAPYCTLSGRMDLGGGGHRYFNYLKGKFTLGSQTARTKEENITANTTDLTYEPVVTTHKFKVEAEKIRGVKAVFADTTDEKFTTAKTWFSKVQTPPEAVQNTSEVTA